MFGANDDVGEPSVLGDNVDDGDKTEDSEPVVPVEGMFVDDDGQLTLHGPLLEDEDGDGKLPVLGDDDVGDGGGEVVNCQPYMHIPPSPPSLNQPWYV